MTRWHDVGVLFSEGGLPGSADSGKCSGKQWIRLAFRLSLPACQAAVASGSTPTFVGDPASPVILRVVAESRQIPSSSAKDLLHESA